MTSTFPLLNPAVTPISGASCHVVAEMGLCMEGDTNTASRMVAEAAAAGAWGVKVQLLRPDHLATSDAAPYWSDHLGNATQREAFARSRPLPYDAFGPLRSEAATLGLAFLATPFDLDAVEACISLGVDGIKIASGDLTNEPLLQAAADAAFRLGVPLVVSTGAATADEIWNAQATILVSSGLVNVVWLACTLAYPTPTAEAHIARIPALGNLVGANVPGSSRAMVGYSDHTVDDFTSLAAAAAGAVLVEKHFTLGDAHNTPDNAMALDPFALASYVVNADAGALLRGEGRLVPHGVEEAARHGARRSVAAAHDLAPGDVLAPGDLTALRPATGLPPSLTSRLYGTAVVRPVPQGALLAPDDLADPERARLP